MTWNSIQSGYVLYCARDGCKGYVLYVSVRMYYREGKREQRDATFAKAQITRERERSVHYFDSNFVCIKREGRYRCRL